MTEANRPAFPIWTEDMPVVGDSGLSKREYYAAKAMQGWLASFGPDAILDRGGEISVANLAFSMADAMLAETEYHNDMLALVERVADISQMADKTARQNLISEARRILGRSE